MKLILCFISLVVLLGFSNSSFAVSAAEQLDPAQSTTVVNPEDKEKLLTGNRTKNNYSIGVSHESGFYEDYEPQSAIFGSATRVIGKKLTAAVAQGFTQEYRKNPRSADTGFAMRDTVLSVSQGAYEDYLTTSWSGKFSATLPFSERSQRLDAITTASLSLSAIKSFYKKKLSFSVTPLARYSVYEYTTTPSEGGGLGTPLPRYSLGISASITYRPHPKWSLSASTGWTNQYYYTTRFENEDPIYGFTNPPKNSYSNGIGLSYDIDKNWGASLSYSHGERYEKAWGTEYLIFNDRVTTWSAGANYAFK